MIDSSLISFQKVLAKDSTKIMLDCTRIAKGADIEIFQSANRNVITIVHKDFYYHITLTDIINAVLMGQEV